MAASDCFSKCVVDGCGRSVWARSRCRPCYCNWYDNEGGREEIQAGDNRRVGENHWGWSGDDAGYSALHKRVRALRGSAEGPCEMCAETVARFEWAQVHESDGLDVMDYMSLCKSCPNKYDIDTHARGEDHGRAKLTDEKVLAIRAEYAAGSTSQRALAAAYSVTQWTVWAVVNHKKWTHVNEDQTERLVAA